jgi:hyperosmotically inducible protein
MRKSYFVILAASLLGFGAGRSAFADQVAGADTSRAQAEIQSKLERDPDLKNNRIQATVDNGVATLKGTVDSTAERAKAAKLALVKGVQQVDNELQVKSQGARAAITDASVTARLKAELIGEDVLRPNDIHVETNNGVVTLSGTVPSEAAHMRALELAKTMSGVNRVEDQLRVGLPGEGNPSK